VWNILKWVLAALAAEFVGQFGRSFALRIIERRRRSAVLKEAHASMDGAAREERGKRLKNAEKIEKKRAKQQLKNTKKRLG